MIVAAAVISAYAVVYGRPGEVPFLPERFKLTPPYRIDLDVYRLGAETLLRGGDLYGTLPDTEIGANLPFTYPPIAAMLFVPLALLTMRDANLLFSFGTLGLLVVVMVLVLREFTDGSGVNGWSWGAWRPEPSASGWSRSGRRWSSARSTWP